MSWRINNDCIEGHNGEIICIMFPVVDSIYARIIKRTPDIMDSVQDFMEIYKSGRKMTKGKIDNFLEIIESTKDCDFKWEIDNDGDLFDKEKGKICFFPNKGTNDDIIIKFVPDLLKAIKENASNFYTEPIQKPLYESLRRVIKQIDGY